MKRTVALAATLLVLAGLAPGTAHAAAGPGEGLRCGFTSMTNPFADGRQTGMLDGGPIVLADGTDPRAGRIRCTIQLDAHRHADPDVASYASLTTPGVAYLPDTAFEYDAGPDQTVVLCTQVEIVGAGTFYWDDEAEEWSTDPYVSCAGALQGPADPWWEDLLYEVWAVVDPVLCAQLAALAPGAGPVTVAPDGDLAVAGSPVWDCPPYEWS